VNELNVLVVGGTGFIGSYLCKELIKRNAQVIVYDLMPNIQAIEEVKDKVEVVRGDVGDLTNILEVVKRRNIDYIVHLAYLLIPESKKYPAMALKVNCEGTLNIFEAARILDVRRVIWASSIAVYGPPEYYGNRPVSEDDPPNPNTLYGACKLFNEHLARHYHKEYGLDIIGLRFTVVYGPGRIRGATAFVKDLIEKPALGLPVKVQYADQEVDWQYIKDAVNAIILAINAKKIKHIIFNTRGYLMSVRDVAEYIRSLIPEAKIELQPGRLGFTMNIDASRAEEELGYKPTYTVERGIKEYINSIRERKGLPTIQ